MPGLRYGPPWGLFPGVLIDQSVCNGIFDQPYNGFCFCFGKDISAVGFHGSFTNKKFLCDFCIAEFLGDQVQDFLLA